MKLASTSSSGYGACIVFVARVLVARIGVLEWVGSASPSSSGCSWHASSSSRGGLRPASSVARMLGARVDALKWMLETRVVVRLTPHMHVRSVIQDNTTS